MTAADHCPFCQSANTHVFSRNLIDYDNQVRTTIDCADCGTSSGFTEKATTEDKIKLKRKENPMKEEAKKPQDPSAVGGFLTDLNALFSKHSVAPSMLGGNALGPDTPVFQGVEGAGKKLLGGGFVPSPTVKQTEKGWLIEYNDVYSSPLWLIALDSIFAYTTPDASEAMRFARKQDAELFMEMFPYQCTGAKATEHAWV